MAEAIGGLAELASRFGEHKDILELVLRTVEEIAAAAPAVRVVDAAVQCVALKLHPSPDSSPSRPVSGGIPQGTVTGNNVSTPASVPLVPQAATPLADPRHPVQAVLWMVLKLVAN